MSGKLFTISRQNSKSLQSDEAVRHSAVLGKRKKRDDSFECESGSK